jgi:hypothetical protein
MKLIEDIKKALELKVRVSFDADIYFEAVLQSKDLDTLLALLREAIGEPLKPPGKQVRFPKKINKIVELIGGVRREQSFYLKEEADGKYIYVALWPWQSDLSKITLKIGRGRF